MAAIDLIVLGMLKEKDMSAYEIQKLVEHRKIPNWVRMSAPSIYKKVLQLEKRGLLRGEAIKDTKLSARTVYSLTDAGEEEFSRLMVEISSQPISGILDFNAVIVNVDNASPDEQRTCISRIEKNLDDARAEMMKERDSRKAEPDPSDIGIAILEQQLALVDTIEQWLTEFKQSRHIN